MDGHLHVLLTAAWTLSTRSSGQAGTTSYFPARTGSVYCKSAALVSDNLNESAKIGFKSNNWSKLATIGIVLGNWSKSATIGIVSGNWWGIPAHQLCVYLTWTGCIVRSLLIGMPFLYWASLATKIQWGWNPGYTHLEHHWMCKFVSHILEGMLGALVQAPHLWCSWEMDWFWEVIAGAAGYLEEGVRWVGIHLYLVQQCLAFDSDIEIGKEISWVGWVVSGVVGHCWVLTQSTIHRGTLQ